MKTTNKTIKKILSLALCLALVMSCVPMVSLNAFAADCDHDFNLDEDIKTAVTCNTCGEVVYESDSRWTEGSYEGFIDGTVATFKGYSEGNTDEIVAYYVVKTNDGELCKLSFDWTINQGYTAYGGFNLYMYHNETEVITHAFTSEANPYRNIISEEYTYTADGKYQVFKFVFEKTNKGTWADGGRTAYLDNINHAREQVEAEHTVTVLPTSNGTVTADKNTATAGETVTLTVTPDEGYMFDSLDVFYMDDATSNWVYIELAEIENGYTFVMPDVDVEVDAKWECYHTGGTATCMGYKCEKCDSWYGEADKTKHTKETYTNGFRDCCGEYEPATQNADGYYEIGNAGQLYWFAEKVNGGEHTLNASLTADIVVNETVFDENGNLIEDTEGLREWEYIDWFYGNFNGNGYTISGLFACTTGEVSFISSNYGTVSELNVENAYLESTDGVVGFVISNNGTIINCSSDIILKADIGAGGIAYSNNGTISSCYFVGEYSADSVTSAKGAIVAHNFKDVSNCYYLATEETDSIDGTTFKTAEQFASGEVAYLLQQGNTEQVWGQDNNQTGATPILDSTGLYKVVTVGETGNYSVANVGDTNGDGTVDVIDYQALVNEILSDSNEQIETASYDDIVRYDLDGDGYLDVIDAYLLHLFINGFATVDVYAVGDYDLNGIAFEEADIKAIKHAIENPEKLATYKKYASDINGDGKVDAEDTTLLTDIYGENTGTECADNVNVYYRWGNKYSTCTATAMCTLCGKKVATETVNTTSETLSELTCTQDGKVKYTATFTNELFEEKTTEIVKKATGHSFNDNGECICGAKLPIVDLASQTEGETVNITEDCRIIGDGNEYNLTLNIAEDAIVIFEVGTSGVKLNAPITVADGKTLTLLVAGDAEHTVNGGISLGNGSNVIIEGDLTQANNKLTVTATGSNAGIGANNGVTAGDITIRNARVDATGSGSASSPKVTGAGIGTAKASMGNILIVNSIVTAAGGYYSEYEAHGAAIGMGSDGVTMGNITLIDSEITASHSGEGHASLIGAGPDFAEGDRDGSDIGTMGDIIITNTDLHLSMADSATDEYAAMIGTADFSGGALSYSVNMGKIIFTDITQAELDEMITTWSIPSDFAQYGGYVLGLGYWTHVYKYNPNEGHCVGTFGGVWVSDGNDGIVQIGDADGYINPETSN